LLVSTKLERSIGLLKEQLEVSKIELSEDD
jgi:hypothetical protein